MYVLTNFTSNSESGSKLAFVPGRVSEFVWDRSMEYMGRPCTDGREEFSHCNMPVMRDGLLKGSFTKGARPEVAFCRNGMFEVLVRQPLAAEVAKTFPGICFNQIECSNCDGDDPYLELERPVCGSLDMKASGYVLGDRCSVCGFQETTRESSGMYKIAYWNADFHVGAVWQNPFLTIVSNEFGEFLLRAARGAFSLERVQD